MTPTEPGRYWFRDRPEVPLEVADVRQEGSGLAVWFVDYEGWAFFMRDTKPEQWYGPCLTPNEIAILREESRQEGYAKGLKDGGDTARWLGVTDGPTIVDKHRALLRELKAKS